MRKLNKPLLRRLARKLRRLRHEEHYRQSTYISRTQCGTAACIGGHAAIEIGRQKVYDHAKKHGRIGELGAVRQILGLRNGRLFAPDPREPWGERYNTAWPELFAARWDARLRGESDERFSRIAADLLDAIADGTVKL